MSINFIEKYNLTLKLFRIILLNYSNTKGDFIDNGGNFMPEKIDSNATEDGKVICNCRNITLGEIKTAIRHGALTIEEIQAKTTAGTGCEKCVGFLEEILAAQK